LIRGLVQGVGFRPYIYRLATGNQLRGRVDNRINGVVIEVEGEEKSFQKFREQITQNPPVASNIKSVEVKDADLKGFKNFSIAVTGGEEPETTEICPDIAVCPECLDDLTNDMYRIAYPFTNCTACGPRFTIVDGLPYDRDRTSMKDFEMCGNCAEEYNDISDRRFHAQPVACNNCGPVYTYFEDGARITGTDNILHALSKRIMEGKSVAIKGIGGYHLICNAFDNDAIAELRRKKQRDAKPFAVMFRDIVSLEDYCVVNPAEFRELTSWRRPVVILKEKKPLSFSVNSGLGTIGALLPYMPLHYLLFCRLEIPALVMTSGNVSEEPLIKDDNDAMKLLLPLTGAIMMHNRKIVNRADDSVVRIAGGKTCLVRRSRGFVPSPVDLSLNSDGVIAFGAEQKNTFCIGKKRQAVMSQHIGDLKNLPAYEFLCESIERFEEMYRFIPSIIACDLHPDYLSTIHAEKLGRKLGIPVMHIQHHHSHLASCMAEHHLDENIIGVCLDGTGYGTDGNIWGGEFLVSNLKEFTRYAHFDYVPVPGGDKAIDEPWRMAFSYLYKYSDLIPGYRSLSCFRDIDPAQIEIIEEMIEKDINSPLSSGAGRLFDAVSAIMGLCRVSGFDSEAPLRLECAIKNETDEYYPYEAGKTIIFAKTLSSIIKDLEDTDMPLIAAKFHNTVAFAVAETCGQIRGETSLNKVVLSGGVFQNRYLLEKITGLLSRDKFDVFTNNLVPPNDGGISLGQLIIAAKTREQCV
jgi:hydrogenase maturation protein HypF